jgi:glutathione synthase/RimK-type ligase-like ATP-grasp enzyme
MKKNILVVDVKNHKRFVHLKPHLITPMQYILEQNLKSSPSDVYNLSEHLGYQDIGYYVSLLAEARSDKVFPSASTIQELKDRYIQKIYSDELFDKIQTKFKSLKENRFELEVYFGETPVDHFSSLAWEFFKMFKAPLLKLQFEKDQHWHLKKVKLLSLSDISDENFLFLEKRIEQYFYLNKRPRDRKNNFLYDLAILINPQESSPPSDSDAIKKFIEAAKDVGIRAYTITHAEKPNLLEFDALFIRETTNVNHHTYRLAKRAQKEGLVVIDDPDSIVRCTNKIYLEQLADKLNIQRPNSRIISSDNFKEQLKFLSYPCVIKRPDSAFSLGVFKAQDEKSFLKISDDLFKKSELLLVQEFISTDFDWRIGILDGEVLFACKYFMAQNHWQIYNNQSAENKVGGYENVPLELVDKKVLKTALKISRAIGEGLYGVDLKQAGKEVYLIEVNDNPSIETEVEDAILGDELYLKIMTYFLKKCHEKRRLIALS